MAKGKKKTARQSMGPRTMISIAAQLAQRAERLLDRATQLNEFATEVESWSRDAERWGEQAEHHEPERLVALALRELLIDELKLIPEEAFGPIGPRVPATKGVQAVSAVVRRSKLAERILARTHSSECCFIPDLTEQVWRLNVMTALAEDLRDDPESGKRR